MKFIRSLFIPLLAASMTGVVQAQTETPAAAESAPAAPQYTDEQLLEVYGWFIGRRSGLLELGFTAEEVDTIVKGFKSAAKEGDPDIKLETAGPLLSAMLQKRQTEYLEAENKKFFAKVDAMEGIVMLPSGLRYKIEKAGTGAYPKATDTVKVHYTGTLVDGTVFDSSVERGEPIEFPLNGVIPGWTEGMQKINVGGKIKLFIPPDLAYGQQPPQGIPPNAPLSFDVELLEIKAPEAAPAAEAAPAVAPAAE